MHSLASPRPAAAIVAALTVLLVSACGGGSEAGPAPTDGATRFVSQIPEAQPDLNRKQVLATSKPTPITTTPTALLDWAQLQFPELFSQLLQVLPSVEYDGKVFNARVYAAPNGGLRYLGVTADGRVFGLGDYTADQLQQFDTLAFWSPQVCGVFPASCSAPDNGAQNAPPGPLNACTQPAQARLTIGNRYSAVYTTTGGSNVPATQISIDAVVIGAETFEGEEAIRVDTHSVITDRSNTVLSVADLRTYQQATPDDFVRTLGAVASVSLTGPVTSRTTVFQPPDLNSEFGLAPGQTFSKTTTSMTVTAPLNEDMRSTVSATFVFIGAETLVLGQKSFQTCHYSQTSNGWVTENWYVEGVGLPARTAVTGPGSGASANTSWTQLRSASLNGVAMF